MPKIINKNRKLNKNNGKHENVDKYVIPDIDSDIPLVGLRSGEMKMSFENNLIFKETVSFSK